MNDNPFRKLPAVHQVLDSQTIKALESAHSHALILNAVRLELDTLRERLKDGKPFDESMQIDAVVSRVASRVQEESVPQIRSVINATGIILHTNLGRSALTEQAALAAYEAARGYLNLELDLETGKRSSRQNPIRDVVAALTGAESATAVNNCAAATVIVLRALAAGKEAIVSRGQLIEIGGSFRIPEIMAVSGAILREVGTTNITRISDYEKAIGPNTGLLMRIHKSNYRIHGFTKDVELAELIELGKRHQIPVIDDVGSGALLDFARFGLPGEPQVQQSIAQGADLVLFSGDKLLGGPQAGIIAGKKALIQKIESDPLMRAFRLDKMTLAALEVTLGHYRNPDLAIELIPTLKMLSTSREQLRERSDNLLQQIRAFAGIAKAEVRDDVAYVGGGSLPDNALPSVVIAIKPVELSESQFANQLRLRSPSIVARIQNGEVLFDLRTVFTHQEEALLSGIQNALEC